MSPPALSFTRAVASGDVNAVRALLAQGADVNAATEGGQTPLILTVVLGHMHVLRVLLEAGANPRLRDSRGLNAIDWAERRGFTEATRLLTDSAYPTNSSTNELGRASGPVEEQRNRRDSEALPPAEAPPKVGGATTSDEKARRWIAGLKRRFDEEARRKVAETRSVPSSYEPPVGNQPLRNSVVADDNLVVESPPAPERAITAPSPEPASKALPESAPRATQNATEASSEQLRTPAATPEQPPTSRSTNATPTRSSRKRCPKCNAVYDSELLAYCAHHIVPLVDADEPLPPPKDETASPLLWILVVLTLSGSVALAFLITDYVDRVNKAGAPIAAPTVQAANVERAFPVVGGELAGKELNLPEPEYPAAARSAAVSGTVTVRVRVNKEGRVISVRSMNGDRRLRAAAVEAAAKATFSPEKLAGKDAVGTIAYTFRP